MKELTPKILNKYINTYRNSLMVLMYAVFANILIYSCAKSGEFFPSVIGSTIEFAFLCFAITFISSAIVDKKLAKLIADKIIKKEDVDSKYNISFIEITLYLFANFFLYKYCLELSIKNNRSGVFIAIILSMIFVTISLAVIKNIGRLIDAPARRKYSDDGEYIFASSDDIAHSDNWHSDASHPASFTNPMSPNFPGWFNI